MLISIASLASFAPLFLTETASSAAGPSVEADPWRLEPAWLASAPLLAPQYDERERADNYVRLSGGLVTTRDSDGPDEDIEFDEGYLIGLALGHRFGDDRDTLGFRLELEGLWNDQDAEDEGLLEAVSDVSVIGALLNGLLDFRLSESFGLYAGGGVGAAWMDIGTESDALNDFDDEDGPFLAWQARAGLEWWSSDRVAWNFGYRFMNIDDVEIDDDVGDESFDLETQQHTLELGVTFGF